jgi:hypothetical protein
MGASGIINFHAVQNIMVAAHWVQSVVEENWGGERTLPSNMALHLTIGRLRRPLVDDQAKVRGNDRVDRDRCS